MNYMLIRSRPPNLPAVPRPLTAAEIQSIVADRFDVPASAMTDTCRRRDYAEARFVAMRLCREFLGLSYPALGMRFGGRDHSSTWYGVRRAESLDDRGAADIIRTRLAALERA